MIGPILASVDQMLIGALLGVAEVAHYAVAMTLVLRSQIVPAALARTLFPKLSSHGLEDAKALAARALETLAWTYGSICATAIVLTPVFFRYWIGADFAARSAPVAEILFLGAWVNGLAFIPYNLLQGQGRPDITGKIHLLEIAPFLAILWTLTKTFGIEGAAIAWTIRVFVDVVALWWTSKLPIAIALRIFPIAVIMACALIVAQMIGPKLASSLIAAGFFGVASGALALYMSAELRRGASLMLKRQRS